MRHQNGLRVQISGHPHKTRPDFLSAPPSPHRRGYMIPRSGCIPTLHFPRSHLFDLQPLPMTSASFGCGFWPQNTQNEFCSIYSQLCCNIYALCSPHFQIWWIFEKDTAPQFWFSGWNVCTRLLDFSAGFHRTFFRSFRPLFSELEGVEKASKKFVLRVNQFRKFIKFTENRSFLRGYHLAVGVSSATKSSEMGLMGPSFH